MPESRLHSWLDQHAADLDQGRQDPATLLPALAASGVFAIGVPSALGGVGGTTADAISAIARVAEHSLTAAFVVWSQRTFIEYLLQSSNAELRERFLPALLKGEIAGATGLSNAMKYLSGIESLQVKAQAEKDGWALNGKLPWITNLRPQGFIVAVVVENQDGGKPAIFAVPHDAPGLERSADLELIALQSSNTAALSFTDVKLDASWRLDDNALHYCPQVRPAFLGLQCGLSLGLARQSLRHTATLLQSPRAVLRDELDALVIALEQQEKLLLTGVDDKRFLQNPSALFRVRIELAEIANAAVQIELQALGGRAYLQNGSPAFARRWREAAFLPVVTPSLVQLKGELARQAAREAVA